MRLAAHEILRFHDIDEPGSGERCAEAGADRLLARRRGLTEALAAWRLEAARGQAA